MIIDSIVRQVRLYVVHRKLVLLNGELEYKKMLYENLGDSARDQSEKASISIRIPVIRNEIETQEDNYEKLIRKN